MTENVLKGALIGGLVDQLVELAPAGSPHRTAFSLLLQQGENWKSRREKDHELK